MKIKILRDYCGKEGTDADKNVFAGSQHHVSRARGSELAANGLAEILSDDDLDADGPDAIASGDEPEDSDGGADEGGEKIEPITANKAAPKPKAKTARKAEA